jgi:hypothetical protein
MNTENTFEGMDDLETAGSAPAVETPKTETPDDAFVRRIKTAQQRVKQFELSPLVKRLLEAACRNVGESKGMGLGEEAKNEVLQRAALFAALDYKLTNVLLRIANDVEHESAPGLCYSVCFAVQKSANFIANLWYRRSLDPALGEGRPAHDYREQREAPYGLAPEEPEEDDSHENVLQALDDLHIYLQLLTESFGWDADSPMPYLFVQEKDGRFTSIHRADQTMDITEVRAQTARVKRQERRAKGLAACLKGAQDALMAAGR